MRNFLLISLIFVLQSGMLFSQVAINADGSAPHPSAGLDINFVNKGLLLPRMSFEQITSIDNPAEGLIIYCTDCNTDATGSLAIFQGGDWRVFTATCVAPYTPIEAVHVASLNQIIWNWNAIPFAGGYKWNDTNDYSTATDIGMATTFTESGLDCWQGYNRYLWAYNSCGESPVLELADSTLMEPLTPAPAFAGTTATDTSIMWFWGTVPGADGYKWNDTNDYSTAFDVSFINFYWDSGLNCLTSYTRYVWAYDDCGRSTPTVMVASTASNPPDAPTNATHVPSVTQIVWNWNAVPGVDGYKWNTTNDYATATDLGTTTTTTETGLTCNTSYSRYVWAYSDCGFSAPTTLSQITSMDPPAAPLASIHDALADQIIWNWNPVSGVDGYKWNTTNNYSTAVDLGSDTTVTQTGLTCNTPYIIYVWAYYNCGYSAATALSQSTALAPPTAPSAATHTPAPTDITWNWHPVAGADGYKWNTTNNYGSATEIGTDTAYSETSLNCNTSYTRYVWAYSDCGVSSAAPLTQATALDPPPAPTPAAHTSSPAQIIWNWNVVTGADGYKWNTTNNYGTAEDLGSLRSKTETGLSCNTSYTRYVWAYNNCGVSGSASLIQSTSLDPPANPVAGSHFPSLTEIVWNWNTVSGATGYKWNTVNNYATAEDLSTVTSKTETGLSCNTSYTRYVWAYSNCGVSSITSLTQATSIDPPPAPTPASHVANPSQIEWKWLTVDGANGYKWGTTSNYGSAQDLGSDTSNIESGLTCNSSYTRYVWAYGACGVSEVASMNHSTALDPPAAPAEGTHVPTPGQIVWDWDIVSGATGYKWNSVNNYGTAQDMGTATTKTQTGLNCNTSYTSYVWSYSSCGVSSQTALTQATSLDPPAAPVAATHVPSPDQVVWNWNTVPGAAGYKWNSANNYGTAQEMGTLTTKTETGLNCNTSYTRYVWAYSDCGVSSAASLIQLTSLDPPAAPVAATHVPAIDGVVWNWNTVGDATGYKWNTTDDFGTAEDMGTATTKSETGLGCNTSYTRYVWAYNNCGASASSSLTQLTSLDPPAAPTASTHVPGGTQIIWNWNTVTDATGYKWNTTNDYGTAQDLGTATSKEETGLSCNTSFTRYVWAYSDCGVSSSISLTDITTTDPPVAPSIATHVAGPTQVEWKWKEVSGASGYKWHIADNYSAATDVGSDTSYTETGLDCNSSYTRYIWAYNDCDNSTSTSLTQVTALDPPAAPGAGTHDASVNQIVWNWNTVSGATGYKWNTTNNYSTAVDLSSSTTTTESGLNCNTSYTRYIWAYSTCGNSGSTTISASTSVDPPVSPTTGTHTATGTQVIWNWNTVDGVNGYKWNTTNNYSTAQDIGTGTSKTETGLACNTAFTRFVWAYGDCGVSLVTNLTHSTTSEGPGNPAPASHTAGGTSIVWNWNTVGGATGYKWNTTNNYSTAQDMGTSTSKNETGLACNTAYTRYVWAYNLCTNSIVTTLTKSTTTVNPPVPTVGTHVPSETQIIWDWNTVSGATGYKWSTVNNFSTAIDVGTNTSRTETGLTCGTGYTRYAWAYNTCGQSTALTMTASTSACWVCGVPLNVNHVVGGVAPVNKSTTYGTVTNIPGETSKCWITKNLGADIQATSMYDGTEAAAGWYWQFNREQGYKHDGTVRTPNSAWINPIDESFSWLPENDPCAIELGAGWRLPTSSEWMNVDAAGGWNSAAAAYGSNLKLHAAGDLYSSTGALQNRQGMSFAKGYYWSGSQNAVLTDLGYALNFSSGAASVDVWNKAYGFTVRCIK